MDDVAALARARASVMQLIDEAAARAGRDPASVEVVAVTKTVPASTIRAAFAAGFRRFGENRVQERQSKAAALEDLDASWDLVGPLQSNKARRAIELFDRVQAVDSVDLAARLGRIAGEVDPGRRLEVLLQVNVDRDRAKSGFEPAAFDRDLEQVLGVPNLSVAGLMTVGRLVDAPERARPTFAALRALSERLRLRDPRLGPGLSMGMTDDYGVAVEEGATIIRIGRAIFGERPHPR